MGKNRDLLLPSQPLVSCIIPTYKRCETLTRAIDSVLNQTYKNLEILIVDDNNPDDEYSKMVQLKLQKYSNRPCVRYISQEKHINGAVARNKGIELSEGDYIAFLDDDDEWLPEKTEKQLTFLLDNPTYGGASCLYYQKKGGEVIHQCAKYSEEDLQFKILSRNVAIFTSTFICKKEILNFTNGFNPCLLRHQDLQFLIDFLNHSLIKPIPDYLVNLHIDSDINRPDSKKLIKIKMDFFQVVDTTIQKFNQHDRKRIKAAHDFEIAFCALKEKRFGIAVQWILKAGLSIQVYRDLFKRYKARK